MTREEHLKYCRICKIQKFDINRGIICGLTNQLADFETYCEFFDEDVELKNKFESNGVENEILNKVASKNKRFANYLIDLVFFMLFSFIFGCILGIVLIIVSPSTFDIIEQDNKLTDYLLGLIAGIIYYSTLETLTGRTIAKYITRTKVVNEKGVKPDYATILLRTICRFIPFEPFSFLGSQNSGWHDRLSKTKVI